MEGLCEAFPHTMVESVQHKVIEGNNIVANTGLNDDELIRMVQYLKSLAQFPQPDGSVIYRTKNDVEVAIVFPSPDGNDIVYFLDKPAAPKAPKNKNVVSTYKDVPQAEMRIKIDEGAAVQKAAEKFAEKDKCERQKSYLESLNKTVSDNGSIKYSAVDGTEVAVAYPNLGGDDIVYFTEAKPAERREASKEEIDPSNEWVAWSDEKSETQSWQMKGTRLSDETENEEPARVSDDEGGGSSPAPASSATTKSVAGESEDLEAKGKADDSGDNGVLKNTVIAGEPEGAIEGSAAVVEVDEGNTAGCSETSCPVVFDSQNSSTGAGFSIAMAGALKFIDDPDFATADGVNSARETAENRPVAQLPIEHVPSRETSAAGEDSGETARPVPSGADGGDELPAGASLFEKRVEEARDGGMGSPGLEGEEDGARSGEESEKREERAAKRDEKTKGADRGVDIAQNVIAGAPLDISSDGRQIADAQSPLGGMVHMDAAAKGSRGEGEKQMKITAEVKPSTGRGDSGDKHNGQGRQNRENKGQKHPQNDVQDDG